MAIICYYSFYYCRHASRGHRRTRVYMLHSFTLTKQTCDVPLSGERAGEGQEPRGLVGSSVFTDRALPGSNSTVVSSLLFYLAVSIEKTGLLILRRTEACSPFHFPFLSRGKLSSKLANTSTLASFSTPRSPGETKWTTSPARERKESAFFIAFYAVCQSLLCDRCLTSVRPILEYCMAGNFPQEFNFVAFFKAIFD